MVTRERDISAEVTEILSQLRAQLDTFTAQRGAKSRLARETRSKLNRIERRARIAGFIEGTS